MVISSEIAGSIGRVVLGGRFSFHCMREFRAATDPMLVDPAVKEIHLDLTACEELDASSLGLLLVLREKAVLAGRRVVLNRPAPQVMASLEGIQFRRLFTISE